MTIVSVGLPFGIVIFIKKFKTKIAERDDTLMKRAGSLVSSLNLDGSDLALSYNAFFVLRRLLFSLSAIFLNDSPLL
jgi:hypothetical protein